MGSDKVATESITVDCKITYSSSTSDNILTTTITTVVTTTIAKKRYIFSAFVAGNKKRTSWVTNLFANKQVYSRVCSVVKLIASVTCSVHHERQFKVVLVFFFLEIM